MINGVLAILFGAFAIFVPETTSKTIAVYFGIVLIVGGIIGILTAIRNMRINRNYMSTLVSSIIGLLFGILILGYTRQSMQVFVIIIGIWALILGLLQLIMALNLLHGQRKKVLVFNSIITIIFGLVLFTNPFASIIALVYLVGILAVIFGAILLYFAFSLKNVEETL